MADIELVIKDFKNRINDYSNDYKFSREEIINILERYELKYNSSLPPVTPEKTTITYKDCSEAMLKMWIDNVLTDGQYNKIMDKLNAKHIEDMKGVSK